MTKRSTKEKDVLDQILDQLDLQGMTQEELFGADGLAKKLTSRLLNKALEAEMDAHLGYKKNSNEGDGSGNSRNGHYDKTVVTGDGEAIISVPRDRNGDFEPAIVKKHERRLPLFNDQIISLLQGDDDEGHTIASEGDLRCGRLPRADKQRDRCRA